MDSEFAVAIIIPLAAFAMLSYIVQVLVEWRRQTLRVKLLTEFQTKLLERMGSGQDFAAFFQSGGGERFLETISLDRANPYDRVIRSLQTGIVSVCLGIGLTVLGRVVAFDGTGFTITGVIMLSLGAGFLLSAAAAYAISKSAGLLEPAWKPSSGRA
jgi:hypothetical protein